MKHTRRSWIGQVAAASLASAAPAASSPYGLFWGDMHNHNAVGYAKGSIERTYDIAESHLDFLAFTPHSQWHDMPSMPGKAEQKWTEGFKVLRENWPKVQKLAAGRNQPGKFVSLLAYEWHSSGFGDYCVYAPDDSLDLLYFDHVKKLQDYARGKKFLAIPHHIAYKQGWRGANFKYFDPSVSPVIEIFSEHGLSESDRGPGDYITHSTGGRWTRNTLREALGNGIRAGLIASTDDHLGFPGAYGEGLAGVYAKDLSREGIFEALRARRTIAITGDRIRLGFQVNDQWMGSALPFARDRALKVTVDGQDEIERVEIVKNGRVLARHFPEDAYKPDGPWPGETLFRLEFGWGPWGMLNMSRVCDWEGTINLKGGRITEVLPCFQAGPFDEKRRNKITSRSETSCGFRSYTSREDAFGQRASNSIVLRMAAPPTATLEVSLTQPAAMKAGATLGQLAKHNDIHFTGEFQSESFILHRLVTPDLFRASMTAADKGRPGQVDCYYAKVTQMNGHQAWSSPVWVEGK